MRLDTFITAAMTTLAFSAAARGQVVEEWVAIHNGVTPRSKDAATAIRPAAPARSTSFPPELVGDWWANVEAQIRRSEYDVTWQERTGLPERGSAWQAPNRAHNLRTYFKADVIRVVPRAGDAPSWRWDLSVKACGRRGDLQSLKRVEPVVAGNRVEYHRGALTEWYLNGPNGLEQGFTIPARPKSPSTNTQKGKSAAQTVDATELLCIVATISGNLRGAQSSAGTIEFTSADGVRVLVYGSPQAHDAHGRKLPIHLELAAHRLSVLVDDAGAEYPVTIDPLTTSAEWTVESDQENAQLGSSVATAGDVNADGYSDVIVGVPLYDAGQSDAGRALVFHGSATGLASSAAWSFDGEQQGANFGWSVATAGDVNGDGYSDSIVGSHLYDGGGIDSGRVYVFYGSPAGLSATADWGATHIGQGAEFGYSVATAGDVNGDGYSDVIIGVPYRDDPPQTDCGAAHVFYGSEAGLDLFNGWTYVWSDSDGECGYSVATAGDVNGDGYADIILGVPGYLNDYGATLVFHGSSSGLDASYDTGFFSTITRRLGCSVSTAGDVNGDGYSDVIVGGELLSQGEANEGWAGIAFGSAGGIGWVGEPWQVESNQAEARLGSSVGTAGDVNGDGYADIIVGAKQYSDGESYEGGAFVWFGSADGLGPEGTLENADWSTQSDQASAIFGRSVATAGDVNGDGYGDVIVGASFYDNGQDNEGRAFVYHGNADGLSTTPGWTSPNGGDSGYGLSIASAGDVNADGYSDFIVGAPDHDAGLIDTGAAYIYHGSETGPPDTPSWATLGDQQNGRLGQKVAAGGDVNGDGYSDIAIGAPYCDRGETNEGIVLVYHGSPTGLDAGGTRPAGDPWNADWAAEGNGASAHLGASLDSAGDVNGDGYGDIVISIESDGVNPPAALVWHGSSTGLGPSGNRTNTDWAATGPPGTFGNPLGSAGDVNGDGFGDVFVCESGYTGSQSMEGQILIYHGSDQGLSGSPDWTAVGNASGMELGRTTARAGDVNGDGYSDIVGGAAHEVTSMVEYRGAAYAFYGSTTGLDQNGTRPQGTPANADWAVVSNQDYARFSESLASAGDVNGDGYSDVAVSAPWYDVWVNHEGAIFVWHGSPDGLGPGGSPTSADWAVAGDTIDRYLGNDVACAGDVNGDGYADLIASAVSPTPGTDAYVFLHYGNAGPGLSLRPQQRRADDSAPIALLGQSNSAVSFNLNVLGRSPYGRQRVALEWEVEPLGSVFDGLGTQVSASYMDTDVTGIVLTELASGLTPGAAHHWRARLLYDPATSPFQQHSRWFAMPGNGMQETKLRTPLLPPIVAVDDSYDTPEDTPLSVDAANGVLDNDYGGSGPFTAEVVSDVSHGQLDLHADGSFDYAPDVDYYGPDPFIYRAFDGFVYSNEASVDLDVTPVNDPPVAFQDTYFAEGNTRLSVPEENGVLVNDVDADQDTLSAFVMEFPTNGLVDLHEDGSFTYDPALNYLGPDSFTYVAFDGQVYSAEVTVTIDVLPRTLHVDDDAGQGGTGSSWDLAYRHLQDALYLAAGDPTVIEVRVGAGSYRPDADEGGNVVPDNPTETFRLRNGLPIYGGYRGLSGGGDENDRDIDSFVTTLTGFLATERSYHVVSSSGNDDTAVLDGFTITGGQAFGPAPDNQGGGSYITSGGPTVSNCTFTDNLADNGGGMANIAATPTVNDCAFEDNVATYYGGGVVNRDGSDATFDQCDFTMNTAQAASAWGGGMYCYSSSPDLIGCTFFENHAQFGGAMYNYWLSSPSLTGCRFEFNTADSYGGAMRNDFQSSPTITDCTFENNQAGHRGGAINNYWYSSPPIHACNFLGNTVLHDTGLGAGGALFNEAYSAPTLTHCTLSNNAAPNYGGAVFNYGTASAEFTNCAFSENSAGLFGGAMTNSRSCTATLQNCTIAGCTAVLGSALACDGGTGYPSLIEVVDSILWNPGDEGVITDASSIMVSFSDVEGGQTAIDVGPSGSLLWGAGNLDAEPLFVNGPLGSLYLSQVAAGQPAESPCVDAGSDTAANLGLDTLTTRADETADTGTVDLGYHYPNKDCNGNGIPDQDDVTGDFDGDGAVSLNDVGGFVQALLYPLTGCRALADMNGDGSANGLDLQPFVDDVLGGGSP
ncbi:MAG: Ig-like domain-containing protein [Planctomycetota bacterium]